MGGARARNPPSPPCGGARGSAPWRSVAAAPALPAVGRIGDDPPGCARRRERGQSVDRQGGGCLAGRGDVATTASTRGADERIAARRAASIAACARGPDQPRTAPAFPRLYGRDPSLRPEPLPVQRLNTPEGVPALVAGRTRAVQLRWDPIENAGKQAIWIDLNSNVRRIGGGARRSSGVECADIRGPRQIVAHLRQIVADSDRLSQAWPRGKNGRRIIDD
jgi:hypothetical protein